MNTHTLFQLSTILGVILAITSLSPTPVSAGVCPRTVTFVADDFEDSFVNCLYYSEVNFGNNETQFQWWYNQIIGAHGAPQGHTEMWLKVNFNSRLDNLAVTKATLKFRSGFHGTDAGWDVYDTSPDWDEGNITCDNSRALLGGFQTTVSNPGIWKFTQADVTSLVVGQYNSGTLSLAWRAQTEEQETTYLSSKESLDPPILEVETLSIPSAPTVPNALVITPSQVQLNWSRPTGHDGGAAYTRYEIYRNDGVIGHDLPILALGDIDANYTNGTVTQLLGSTTYSFAVVAINGFGCSSEQGQFVNVTTLAAVVPIAPEPVSFVSATGGAVTLSWNAPLDHGGSLVTQYTIYQDGAPVATTFANTTTFQVPGLSPSTSYNWQVLATNGIGNSPLSSGQSFATTVATVPSGPTVSPSLAIVLGGLLEVSWNPPYDDGGSPVTGYQLFQDGALIYDGSGSTTTVFNATLLSHSTTYGFKVTAINAVGTGPAGPEQFHTTSPATPPSHMEPPTLGYSTAGMQNLTWIAPPNNGGLPIFRYRLFIDPGPTNIYTGPNLEALSGGLRASTAYTYYVSAENAAGVSTLSGPATFTTGAATVPGPPGPPVYHYPVTDGSIPLQWTTPLDTGGVDITGYEVLYQNGTVALTVGNNVTYGVVLNQLVPSSAYNFTVRAINSLGTGPESDFRTHYTAAGNTASIRPDAPTSPEQTGGRILVSWQVPEDTGNLPVTSYSLYQGGTLVYVGSATEFNVTNGITASTSYDFTVRANNALGSSPYSDVLTATTLAATVPGPPVNLARNAATAGTITVGWSAPPDSGGATVTEYNVFRDSVFVGTSSVISYTDGYTLLANTTYQYTVSAINVIGEGVQSDPFSITTDEVPTVPSAPLAPVFGAIGPTSVNVTWAAPLENGGSTITAYQVYVDGELVYNGTNGDQTYFQVTSNSTFQLRGSTPYSFEVVAVNDLGYSFKSPAAIATTTAATVPGQMDPVTFPIVTSGRIRVAWTAAADDGGSYVTSYSLYEGAALRYTGTALQVDIGNLLDGDSHTYHIVANNAIGSSPNSATNTVTLDTPATAPEMLAAPTNGGPTGGSILVQWQPPLDRGGDPIVQYTLYRDGVQVYSGAALTYTDQGDNGIGLTALTTYNYTVVATNGAGTSDLSIPGGLLSTAARTVPGNPAPPSAFNASGSAITVQWAHPPETGGAPILGYQVFRDGSLVYNAPSDPQLFFIDEPLAGSTSYSYTVRALNAEGNGVMSLAASLSTLAPTPPDQPDPPTFANVMGSTMDVNWAVPAQVNGAPVTQWSLYWDAGSGGATTTLLYQGPALTYNFAANNTYIEALTAYKFAVTATSSAGDSTKSADATQTTGTADPPFGVPAPTVVLATGGSINLTWPYPTEDGGSAITSYTLYQDGSAIYTGSERWFEAGGLSILTTYCYTYMANNTAAGTLSPQTCQSTTFGDPPDAPNPAPTVGTVTGGRIQLFWTAPANDGGRPVTGYNLYFDDGSGGVNWTLTATTPGSTLNYTKYKILGSTTYQFYVTALNENGESPASPIVSQATLAPHVPDPVSVWIVGPATYSTVQLQWEPPLDEGGSPILGYYMWDNRPGGSSNPANKRWDGTSHPDRTPITADQRSTLDMGLGPTKVYRYRITAFNAIGSCSDTTIPSNINSCLNPVSHTSDPLDTTTAGASGPPLSPTNAPTFSSITPTSAQVDWVASEDDGGAYDQPCASGGTAVACPGNIDRYILYRDDGNGGAVDIYVGETTGSGVNAPITGLSPETTYTVHIYAENSFGNSTNPKPGLLTTSGPPGPPGTPVFGAVTGSTIAMSWSAPTDDGFIPNTAPAGITGYEIWYDQGIGSLTLKTTIGATTSYTDTGLSAATTYLYRIKALTTGGASDFSNPNSQATTPPSPPGAPGVAVPSDLTPTSVRISWTAPTDDGGSPVTSYDLFWNNGNVNASVPPTILLASGNFLTYLVSPITLGPVYRFAARAVTLGGPGPLGGIGDVVAAGFALSLDGTGVITLPATPLLDSLTDITVEFWFRMPTVVTNKWRTIIVKDNSGLIPGIETTEFAAFVDFKGFLGIAIGRGANKGVSYLHYNQFLRDNTWYHVSFTVSGSTGNLYVNGDLVDTTTDITSRSFEANTPVVIGQWVNWIYDNWIGDIDELRIWNIARTPSDIAATVNGAVNPASAGLVAYYKMDENTGTQIGDDTANNLDSNDPWTGGVSWIADDRIV